MADLTVAIAAVWVGGVVVIGGVDRIRAYIRHHRPVVRRPATNLWRPGPSRDL
jgi:hypothetical protein